jgi:predicted lipoprotein with Yx(FWY)xxD motif
MLKGFAALSGALIVAGGVTTSASAAAAGGAPGTTVSLTASPYGNVLVAGSGPFAGFSLYDLSSDHPPSYGCTTHVVILLGHTELSCIEEWPPLLTTGAPVAGSGVNPSLLGMVFRPNIGADQVTYAGHPLYLFDNAPGEFTGQRWDEPSLPPWHGDWYLVSPSGAPASGTAVIRPETLSGGATVLGSVMSTHLGRVDFTVYTFSADTFDHATCTGACARAWMPVLSAGPPKLAHGLLTRDFGTITLHDGTEQVTFEGHPLYLFSDEGLSVGSTGVTSDGNGNGITAFGGTFSVVTLSS